MLSVIDSKNLMLSVIGTPHHHPQFSFQLLDLDLVQNTELYAAHFMTELLIGVASPSFAKEHVPVSFTK